MRRDLTTPPTNHTTTLSTHEKLLAALAHIAVLLPGIGTAGALLIWQNQRGKSRFASQQAMQAAWWQTLLPLFTQVVLLIAGLIFIGAAGLSGFTATIKGTEAADAPSRSLMIALVTGMIAALGLYSLVGLVAAVACLFGKNFVYPFFGRRLQNSLRRDRAEGEALNFSAEERLAAGAAHAAMFVPLLGMLVPLVIWLAVKNATPGLRFHALQALLAQGAAVVASSVSLGILLALSVPFSLAAIGLWNAPDASPLLIGLTILLVVLVFLFSTISTLILPLFGLFGLIAMLKVLRGKAYRYPFIKRIFPLNTEGEKPL